MATTNPKARLDALLLAYEREVLDMPSAELGSTEEIDEVATPARQIAQVALLASLSTAPAPSVIAGARRQRSTRRPLQPPQNVTASSRNQPERLRATFGVEANSSEPDAEDVLGKGEDDSTD